MKQINLYQAEFRPPNVLLPAHKMAWSGGVFIVGLLALYFWNGWQLRQLQQQVGLVVQHAEAVNRQVQGSTPGAAQASPELLRQAETLEAQVRSLQQAQDAIASGAVGSEAGYAAQFQALARAVGNSASPGAWLTGVTLFDNGHAMDLRGRTLGGAETAHLISNLRREPLFVGLSFAALQVMPPPPKVGEAATAQPVSPPPPPRYLEFSLNARLQEQAEQKLPSQASLLGRAP